MRAMRHLAYLTLVLVCSVLGLAAWAGDQLPDDPEAKRLSAELPKKEQDLSGVDVGRPVEDPRVTERRQQEQQPDKQPDKTKQVTRYRSADIAPEGPETVCEFTDVSRLRLSAEKSPLGRLLGEDLLGRLWHTRIIGYAREMPPVAKGTPSGSGLVDIFTRMSEMLKGEAIVAFYPPAQGAKMPGMLVVATMEDAERGAFVDSLPELRNWAGWGEEASSKTVTSGDFEYDQVTYEKRTVACYGFVGNQLVVTLGEGKLYERVLACAQSKGDHSLSRDREWAAARGKLAKNSDVYLKVDVGALAEMLIRQDMKDEERKALKAGMKGIRHFAASVSFSTDAVRERFYLELDPESELMKTIAKASPNPAIAKLIPLDSVYYAISAVDPGATLESYRRMKKGLTPEQVKQIDDMFEKVLKKCKLSMEEDVLPAFAGTVACSVVVTGMGASTDFDVLLVLQPSSMDQVRKVLAGLDSVSKEEGFKSELYKGADLRAWVKPKADDKIPPIKFDAMIPWLSKTKELGEGPLGPVKAYALTSQYVIFGTSERVVKLAVRQTDPTEQRSSIEDKADYKTGRQDVGVVPNETGSGYLDLRRVAELLYSASGASGLGAELPPADRLLGELGGAVWSVRREASGMSADMISPVGMLPLSAAGGVGGWVWIMKTIADREEAQHTAKLKSIWRGMETFATDFGRYPLKLSELFKTYVEDSSNFVGPDQPEEKIKDHTEVDAKTGYRYVTGRSPISAANTLIVYSARPDSRGRHWCLYTNGKVGAVAAEVLDEVLGKKKSR